MSIKFDLDQVVNQVGKDKGIDKTILIEALESAVLSAAKKHYGHNKVIETKYNSDRGEIEVFQFWTVVDGVIDDQTEISIEHAKDKYDPEVEVGEEIGTKLNSDALGRIAAQTAKQVIFQKLRDAEQDIIFDEFRDRKGDLVNGTVQRFERNGIIVNLGRTDAILPDREQISKERYKQGDKIRCLILNIEPANRGPQVILTRSHPDFLRKLFEQEVPEIADGTIEIKAVSREPGERAKIAVHSNDIAVDPRGACIGVKGSRVQNIVSELKGERIEIVLWSPDTPSFVARALSPAEVIRIIVDEDVKSMEVIVEDTQLSLAIGKRGQNVKLASRLTGWKIDVRSESVAEQQQKIAREKLESIEGIGLGEAELLYQEGFSNIEDLASAEIEELVTVGGFSEERAQLIVDGAKKIMLTASSNIPEQGTNAARAIGSDIDTLLISDDIKETLIIGGYDSIQSLAGVNPGELEKNLLIDAAKAKQVVSAVEGFLRYQDS